MNIKKQILEASRLLFNEKGVMNTTLRDVAKSMNKSYGNITYHFQTKEDVLFSLLDEMNKELIALQEIKESENL
jgi:AcrR family transcriptional regulator